MTYEEMDRFSILFAKYKKEGFLGDSERMEFQHLSRLFQNMMRTVEREV